MWLLLIGLVLGGLVGWVLGHYYGKEQVRAEWDAATASEARRAAEARAR